jgi:putative tricarboxylic transport membrane protein
VEIVTSSLFDIVTSSQILYLIVGTVLGVIAGAIPGINGGMLMVLSLPLTFYMGSESAVALLIGMYVGGVTGGLVPALLIRIPGSPSSIVTTFDGYPMVERGSGGRAFALGIVASFIGGLISWVFLISLSPLLTAVALSFSDYEYFAFVIMGLAFIATISGGSLLKGIVAAVFGIMVAMPGIDQVAGVPRLHFGFDWMLGGFDLLAVLIGVFAGSQLLLLSAQPDPEVGSVRQSVGIREIVRSILPLRRHTVALLRSGVIGTWIGILPGIGASVGSLVSYGVARNMSPHPEKFGSGIEEGVIASEAANNATVGGALVPLITIGIPGSIGDAILISALIIHNVQVGPLFFQNHPDVYFAILGSAFWSNFVVLASMILLVPLLAKLINLPRSALIPTLWVFCVVGAFATNNSYEDVWIMFAFSVVGFLLERFKYPLGPFVIGLILGPLAEKSLRAGLMASNGDYTPFIERPVAAAALALSAALIAWSLWKEFQQAKRTSNRAGGPT